MWTFANAPERCHRVDFLFREMIWEQKAFHTRGSNICHRNQGIIGKNSRGKTSFSFSGKNIIAWTEETQTTRHITSKSFLVTDFLTGETTFIIPASCISLYEDPASICIGIGDHKYFHRPSAFAGQVSNILRGLHVRLSRIWAFVHREGFPPALLCTHCWGGGQELPGRGTPRSELWGGKKGRCGASTGGLCFSVLLRVC